MHFKLFQKRESVKFDYAGKLVLNSAASPNAASMKIFISKEGGRAKCSLGAG